MKKYSSLYPLVFGVLILILGIFTKQFVIVLFGILPIIISIFLILFDHRKNSQAKKKSRVSPTMSIVADVNTQSENEESQSCPEMPTPENMKKLLEKSLAQNEFDKFIIGCKPYLALVRDDYVDFTPPYYKLKGINEYLKSKNENEKEAISNMLLSVLKNNDFMVTFSICRLLIHYIEYQENYPDIILNVIDLLIETFKLLPSQEPQMKLYTKGVFSSVEDGMLGVLNNCQDGTTVKVLRDIIPIVGEDIVKNHITITKGSISSNFFFGGIPCIEKQGLEKYKLIKSYDDMRGPQGIEFELSKDEAIKKYSDVIIDYATHKERFYYYHPEWEK